MQVPIARTEKQQGARVSAEKQESRRLGVIEAISFLEGSPTAWVDGEVD